MLQALCVPQTIFRMCPAEGIPAAFRSGDRKTLQCRPVDLDA
jgi:hypothetical protein